MKISFEKLFKWVCTGFLIMMIGMVPIMAIGTVLQPVATATNAIVSFFKGLNGNADTEGIEESVKAWINSPEYQGISKYKPSDYRSYYLAQSVSFYYFKTTGEFIVSDGDYAAYMQIFKDADSQECLKEIESRYGFKMSEDESTNVKSLAVALIPGGQRGINDPVGEPVERAIAWMTQIANDDSHGYSQITRNGNPNYDCSSLICSAMRYAGGFNIPITSTHSMRLVFTNAGNWIWIPRSELGDISNEAVISGRSNLKRGDILLNETEHTEIYLGNGLDLGAHWDWDGVNGDSSGKEICSGLYWDSNWDGVLRYVGN